MTAVDGVLSWLTDGAPGAATRAELMAALGERLDAAGLPVDRLALFVTVLHPDIANRSFVWRRDRPVQISAAGYDLLQSERFLTNPLVRVRQDGAAFRWRSADPAVPEPATGRPSAFIEELRGEGFTDYVAMPLRFTSGETQAVSWATQRPGGFSETELAAFARLAPPLARLAEIHSLRRTAITLLETYIGRQTGARVLAGHIRRGDTESIHAAIWLSDLRGFTALADRLPPADLIALLDRYFECQVPAIEAHGGEVLKFMGDGLLAIFPIGPEGPAPICAAALAAAQEARAQVLALARESAEQLSLPPFSLALHLGEVLYGNVGGGHRLDFTVIGPAVNLASRLERLARDLGHTIIASAEFAELCGTPLLPLGRYVLRGIAAAQPAFGLPDEGAPKTGGAAGG